MYRTVFELIGDAALLLTGDRIRDCNASARRMFGGDRATLEGKTFADLSPPAQPNARASEVAMTERLSAVGGGEPQTFEWMCRRFDGKTFPVEISLVHVDPPEGGAGFVLASLRDISAFKLAQEKYGRIYAVSSDLLGVLSRDGRFKELSPAWEAALGYSREEMIGKAVVEFVHPDDRKRTTPDGIRLSGEVIRGLENRYMCKDGSLKWLELSFTLSREEGLIYFAARDVTARKLAERALRESEERFRSLAENAPGYIMTLDASGCILSINRVGAGVNVEDLIGLNVYGIAQPESVDLLRETFETVLRTGEVARLETPLKGIDAEPRWYAAVVGPLRRGGELTGLIVIATDVTDRKLLEQRVAESMQQLKGYAAELEEKNALLEKEILDRKQTEQALHLQQEAIVALSAPVIKVWDGVLALPVIGTVDRARALQMMEKLLHEIVKNEALFTILDLTGVEVVDAETATHLLSIVRAANLLGSRCVVSGVSTLTAQTMVDLDIEIEQLVTFATLQDALRDALERLRRRPR
jgi:PAS domain S-box-containing protein